MKRIVSILLALLMLLSLTACGNNVKTKRTEDEIDDRAFRIGDMFANFDDEETEVVISSYIGEKSKVKIPDTVDKVPVVGIAPTTFACTPVKSITFGKNLYYIGAYAFQETKIKEIKIPEGITYLGDGLFYNCEELKKVTLPESLITIGNNIFDGVTNTVTVKVVEGSEADTYCSKLVDEGVDLVIERSAAK